ncbi:hypothetical protein [Oryzobacter telluris]|uniref:hypothetical protein n=1 Tax=Oryzobacter telluris TaxID=3149179 RepID=UPI00370D07D7
MTRRRAPVEDVVEHLSRPRPYREVEDAEAELLASWRDVLSGQCGDLDELEAFSHFFSRLGFLFKYKVYGVKVALPFGYSLFDLVDGEGFSFQVHEEPKLEGFHVLAPRSRSLLYVADRAEWEAEGRAWATTASWERRGERVPRGALVPMAGDVAAVRETGVVHTVLGCVLEEYASCSVDSVVRLHDQNVRTDVRLPSAHPSVPRLLAAGSTGLPRRHLVRSTSGWARTTPAHPGEVIDTGHVRGWREVLAPGATLCLPAGQHVTSVVVVRGRACASVSRSLTTRRAGEVVVVPPGLALTVEAEIPTTLSVHQVPTHLATYAWGR